MENFDRVPVLETNLSSYTQEVFPSNFEFETDRNLYSDMRDTHLILKLRLFKGRLFDAFKKEKAEHKATSEEEPVKKFLSSPLELLELFSCSARFRITLFDLKFIRNDCSNFS